MGGLSCSEVAVAEYFARSDSQNAESVIWRPPSMDDRVALVVELGEHGNTTLDPMGFANGGGNKDVKNEIRGVTYGACNVTRKSTSIILTRAVASSS